MTPDSSPTAALQDATVPLETTTPDVDGPGLHAIGNTLEDARVVGLGEATHGTREFFELKHRVVRHLVEEHGLRLFAIEASFGEITVLDNYVRDGNGDLDDVMNGLMFWTWRTEEVREFVAWARAFNRGRDPGDKLRFYGCDVQFVHESAGPLGEYLAAVDTEFHETVADDLDTFADGFPRDDDDKFADAVETLDRTASDVADRLDARRETYVDATGERDWRLARQHATVLEQAATTHGAKVEHDGEELPEDGIRARDRSMAENVTWILDHEPHDQVAVWAHNGHVKRGRMEWDDGTARTMGDHLGDRFGDDYHAVGFAFHHGAFQAIDDSDDERGLREFSVSGTRDGSLADHVASTDYALGFLDVDAARTAGLDDWLDDDHDARSVGATFSDATPDEYWETYTPGQDFDSLLYVEKTTRARPLDD